MTTQSELAVRRETFDEGKAERFAERMLAALNEAALTVMTSIGHRTGLFDTMAALPAATAETIAEAAGLDERYVREWLAAMTTARVVVYDPAARTYLLPGEHAAFLTRAACPDSLAIPAQYIPLLAQAEDHVVERFREGGGLAYDCYPGFHRVMAEDSGQTVVLALFDRVLPLVPGLTERLEEGIDVLDVGCGSGRALNEMAARFPRSSFRGYDLGEEAIARARAEARERGLANVAFETRDATRLDEIQRYDLITTFDAVHDQSSPARLLRAIHRALAPGGVYLMQDIAGSSYLEDNLEHPVATLLYTISCMHCMPVSLGQGGEGLGTMWGEEQALRLLGEAGFTTVERKRLAHDFMNVYFVCTR